jgi:hypothetical protein
LSKAYENRWYLYDVETGRRLRTTVMWDNRKRIEGTGNVVKRLRKRLLDKAKEFGGKNLETRMFIDTFSLRGPRYGDVVRQVMREFHAEGKIQMRNVGTRKRPRYRYSLV